MKKLSLLITLALIVTITGVYAAWNYAQGASASVEITREINMAQVNTNSNKGTISVSPNNVAFIVDNDGTLTPEGKDAYHAALTGTGEFAITFTPSTGADATTATSGILMYAKVEIKAKEGAALYQGQTPISVVENNIITINEELSKTATLSIESVLAKLVLMDVNLPTKQDNDNFHNVLKDYTIVITICESVLG